MMKKLFVAGVAAAVLMIPVVPSVAKDDAAPAAPKAEKAAKVDKPAPAPLQEITLTGKISKEEVADKKTGANVSKYFLTDAQGAKTVIPVSRPKVDKKTGVAEPVLNLDQYVGSDVKLLGMGSQADRKGKMVITIRSVKSIEKLGAQ